MPEPNTQVVPLHPVEVVIGVKLGARFLKAATQTWKYVLYAQEVNI